MGPGYGSTSLNFEGFEPVPNYLVRHGAGWKYKRQVPPDIRAALNGRKTWIMTLGSIGKPAALVAARELAVDHDALIVQLRSMPEAQRSFIAEHGGYDGLQRNADWYAQHAAHIRRIADALDTVPESVYEGAAAHGLSRGDLAESFMKTRKEANVFEKQVALTRKVLAPPPSDRQLAGLIPIWLKVAQPRSPKVIQKMHRYVERFVRIVGNFAPRDITRMYVMRFRDAVEKDYKRGTAVKHLENIHALFNAANKEGVIDINPAHNVKVRSKPPLDGGKKPFQPAQVRAIFEAMSDESGDFKWLVRLLAYHGARSGELAELHADDVTTSMGIPILHIHRQAPGSLKNRSSRREVPIHPSCLGIIDYAKAAAGPWLFGSFPTWKGGRAAWFQRYGSEWLRKTAKIKDPLLTFHSLRHSWRTIAREKNMPEPVSLAIMGHSPGKGEHAAYGAGPSLKLRARWLARIDPLK
jgi:integrase